jgi:hypothetical protein
MRIFGRVRRAVLATLMLGACAAPHSANSDGAETGPVVAEAEDDYPYKTILFRKMWEDGRPVDFYRLIFDDAPEVCGPVIKALNEPHQPPVGATHKIAKIFLESRLSVEWTDLRSDYGNNVARANVDIFGVGEAATVFRFIEMAGVGQGHRIFIGSSESSILGEFTNVQRMGFLRAAGAADRGEAPKGSSAVIAFDRERMQQYAHANERNFLGLWVDIANIGDRAYMLVGRSELITGAPMTNFLLVARSNAEHQLLCSIRSNYVISPIAR